MTQLGLLDLPWWGYLLVTLGLTHVTIAAVTIFLHRHQAHHALATASATIGVTAVSQRRTLRKISCRGAS